MADKNRDEGPAEDDDSIDDGEFDAELDEDVDEESLDGEDDDAPATTRRQTAGAGARARVAARTRTRDARPNIFSKIVNFIREIFAELQKVIWPTRKELLTYTTVVIVFVAIMMSFVAGLDVGFARLMFLVFGSSDTN